MIRIEFTGKDETILFTSGRNCPGPNQAGLAPNRRTGDLRFPWCTVVAVAAGYSERQRGAVGKWSKGEADEVMHPFWAAAGREAHQDASSMVMHDGQNGLPVAGHSRGGGRMLMARGGAACRRGSQRLSSRTGGGPEQLGTGGVLAVTGADGAGSVQGDFPGFLRPATRLACGGGPRVV
jgi:hypothetical protein